MANKPVPGKNGDVYVPYDARSGASSVVYFTRDRYYDEDDHNTSRYDEWILMLRDALGREIPW